MRSWKDALALSSIAPPPVHVGRSYSVHISLVNGLGFGTTCTGDETDEACTNWQIV